MRIISKIRIHPFFYFFALICVLIGYFKNFIYISLIIFIHELGHILVALYYSWNIEKIVILPFGGITIFNEKINKSMKEEFLIAISGPIFQSLLFFKIKNPIFYSINLSILLFNLIPIIPLDGSKILNMLLNKIFPFKLSHKISIIVSLIFISLFLVSFNLIMYIIIIFFINKVIREVKNHSFIFNKFLFERYLYNIPFKKVKIVNNIKKMKRDYKHIFYKEKRYYLEKEILVELFDK